MRRTEEEWRVFARGIIKSVSASKTIGVVNAIEKHNATLFLELKKASMSMHDHLIKHMDDRRIEIVRTIKKGNVK